MDILSSHPVDLYELGIREKDDILRHIKAAVFVEVKYNNNDRDLMFEIQKHINFRDWYIECGKSFCYIVVISDNFDNNMAKFLHDNEVIMYKYNIENEDLNTFTIKEYEIINNN